MRVVVVGAGMVGHRFADDLARLAPHAEVDLVGAEPHAPYNRVLLTELLAGRVEPDALTLPRPAAPVRVWAGAEALHLDRERRVVATAERTFGYDHLVLATGARARRLPVDGLGDPMPRGAHVLRSLQDARAVEVAALHARRTVVVGSGPLGLEAACALAHRGVPVTLVSASATVLARDLDPEAGEVVGRSLRGLGLDVREAAVLEAVETVDGRVAGVRLDSGTVKADLLLLACGSEPETRLARAAGLAVDGGVVVDADLATGDPRVSAIGDCARTPGGTSGLVGPGWQQAAALARRLAGASPAPAAIVAGAAMRLKAAGLDVVTEGVRGSVAEPDDRVLAVHDPRAGRHVEVVVRGDELAGFTCVGDGDLAAHLSTQVGRPGVLPPDPLQLLLGTSGAAPTASGSPTTMPAATTVCRCNGVTKGDLVDAWEDGCTSVPALADRTRATTGCGGCLRLVQGVAQWLEQVDPPASQPDPGARERSVPAT